MANVHIARDPVSGKPGISGRMLVDDKSGSSFDIKQAQDYAKMVLGQAKGPRVDGMMYVFDSKNAAEAAYNKIKEDNLCGPLLGRKMRMAYFSPTGKLGVLL